MSLLFTASLPEINVCSALLSSFFPLEVCSKLKTIGVMVCKLQGALPLQLGFVYTSHLQPAEVC